MKNSRARRSLAVIMLMCLGAITSGCVWPETARVFPVRQRVRVDSPSQPSALVMRLTDQEVPIERPLLPEDLPGPIADTSPQEVPSIEPPTLPDITPTPSGLTLTVVDLIDPAPKGEKLTYRIVVSNDGETAERDVSVVVTLPYELVPDLTDTVGAGGRTIEGQIVRFDPMAEIGPGERREYQVVVRARQSGQLVVRAQLTSDRLSRPLDAEATTEVLP